MRFPTSTVLSVALLPTTALSDWKKTENRELGWEIRTLTTEVQVESHARPKAFSKPRFNRAPRFYKGSHLSRSRTIYTYAHGPGIVEKGKGRSTRHQFYWKGALALVIWEHEKQEDFFLGRHTTTYPNAKATVSTIDLDNDGTIDLVTIGDHEIEKELEFGRYKDGVFALTPPVGLSFTELMAHLRKNTSEQAEDANAEDAPE